MSFRFVFGASGAGKSSMLYEDVIRRSLKTPDHSVHYVFVVPDQYTLQVQKDLVLAHPNRGIMDIEVLSFNRLTHRIFEETGAGTQTLLDDTGKNLIVRRIAAAHEKELSVLAGRMHTPGMISEVKSVLSEFLQYGIGPEDVARMKERAREGERRRLFLRLQDLEILYRAFLKYERDRFITSEETLDLLAEAIPTSEFIRRSVLVFDGFTGFTPVQYRVLGELMRCAIQVTFSFQYADDGFVPMPQVIASGNPGSEAALFYMTRRSVCDLVKLAGERDVPHGEDIYIRGETPQRFAESPAMAHLERHLFRSGQLPYEGGDKVPELLESSTPEEEVRQMFIRLRKEIAAGGGAFRDYAVICSDPETYVPILNRLSLRYEVPLYIDETSGAMHNVLTEHIRSALRIRLSGFSYESVFHYLRAGLSGLTREETDLLENECLRRGVRSRKKWELAFSAETEPLRKRFLDEISPLLAPVRTAAERSEALYSFLRAGGVKRRLEEMAKELRAAQDEERAIAYGQIYDKVLGLLRQICELIGEEKISGEEYLLLLEAGFAEHRLGTLPQNVDSVLVGDMERTRLPEIRTLFFLGVNDDFVPRRTAGGGLISEMERAFLK
ncbi:MAG: helicase-exonuclease AddAB subunit AddB, partial [Lachnospiraceae bacterium]|nr:helicase-exonuclease AddAB subunit AddB [Lachnospiraceae bacterium]